MAEIKIRPAISTDIPKMVALDHNYATDHVWQMTLDLTEIQTQVSFREVRLPREVHVNYPRLNRDLLLLAEEDEAVRGYISVQLGKAPASAWVMDLNVDRIHRRNGIGTALVLAAQDWCARKRVHRLTLEMQIKFYVPASSYKIYQFLNRWLHPAGDLGAFYRPTP